MSNIGKKLFEQTVGLGAVLDKAAKKPTPSRSAPSQLMAFTGEQLRYEKAVASLEARLADADKSMLRIEDIDPNPWQPRLKFDPVKLQELADGIAAVGLIQPIVVRRKCVTLCDTLDNVRYELIAGERRLRAHKLLGKADIKAVIIEVVDSDMVVLALAENLEREDLSDYEVSKALRLAEPQFKSRKSLADAIGRARQDMYRYFAFECLPDYVLADLEQDGRLMGRGSAELLSKVLKTHGALAEKRLMSLWPGVISGRIAASQLPGLIEFEIIRGTTAKTDRSIRKLFVGHGQVGSITKDAKSFVVKIKSSSLTSKSEADLIAYIENLFGSNSVT